MDLTEFADIMTRIEDASGSNKKKAILRGLFQGYSQEEIVVFTRVALGELFDDPSRNTNVSDNRVLSAVGSLVGISKSELDEKKTELGKPEEAVEWAFENRNQEGVVPSTTTIEQVYRAIDSLPDAAGDNDREKILKGMFGDCNDPEEARWVAYCALNSLSLGMGWKTVAGAFAQIEQLNKEDVYRSKRIMGKLPQVIDYYYSEGGLKLYPDFGEPFKPMLAEGGTSPEDYGKGWMAQTKYDGARVLIHSADYTLQEGIKMNGEPVKIFSRNQQDVSESLPEITNELRLDENEMILDGEVVAYKDGELQPFQQIMRRFRREHNIEEMVQEIQAKVFVFDIIYLNGEWLLDEPAWKRYELLPEELADMENLEIAKISNDITGMYEESLARGHEGIIVKDWESPWVFSRSDAWQKLKPEETLDLEIIGYEVGEGQYAGQLGALEVGAYDEEEDQVVSLGKVGNGFEDHEKAKWTPEKKDDLIGQIITVESEELQLSDGDGPGGLRFARIPSGTSMDDALRDTKDEPDTLQKAKDELAFQD